MVTYWELLQGLMLLWYGEGLLMAHEHEIHTEGEPDPTDMQGYNYLVNGDREEVEVTAPLYQKQVDITKAEIVTLQKVWQCQGKLLRGETGQRLKDICLSFALFRLLYRRFGGHPFSERGHDKTWRLVQKGLLSEEGDYNKVFRVIEVELYFLFDLFYTKYAVNFKGGQGFNKFKLLDAIFMVLGCIVAGKILSDYEPSDDLNLIIVGYISVDKLVTRWKLRHLISGSLDVPRQGLKGSHHIPLPEQHLATSLCEIATKEKSTLKTKEDFTVATKLSDYCAYLVAFAPRLIFYEAIVAESIFDEVLADFWAELMLFLAPTGDPRAHAEYLAKGGQFVTHLWALLSHASILPQSSTSQDV
ncbi:hypothetical protein SLEP1_g55960 [Rubroshorea leprosula]|uniref:DUF4220 domain-containing protein n=1 Tax=Rubroshorea leprosula TaxID=152421 RepID=A0AAV5ML91_9ROSI|nr:hypothetical protein SLEP1_g55960 [Rubroshorea leprosula]